jgi:hypothetical protein
MMNKFGTRDLPRLIDELRFQERRHAAFDEGQLSKLLQDAADSLEAADRYYMAVESALI